MLLLSPPPPLFSWTNHFSPYPPELGKAVCCWCRCRWCGRKTCNHCCYQGKPHRFVHYHAVHMLLFRSAELLLLMRFFFLIIFFVSYALCFIFSAGYTSSIFIIASRSFRCLCVCMRSVVIYNAQCIACYNVLYYSIIMYLSHRRTACFSACMHLKATWLSSVYFVDNSGVVVVFRRQRPTPTWFVVSVLFFFLVVFVDSLVFWSIGMSTLFLVREFSNKKLIRSTMWSISFENLFNSVGGASARVECMCVCCVFVRVFDREDNRWWPKKKTAQNTCHQSGREKKLFREFQTQSHVAG